MNAPPSSPAPAPSEGRLFDAAPDGAIRDLGTLIEANFSTRRHGPGREATVLLDTFDWRLLRAGFELTLERGSPPTLVSRRKGRVRRQEVVSEIGFARDLPPGPLRDELLPVSGVRRLQVRLGRRAKVTRFDLLDAEQKTVARIALSAREVRAEDHGPWVEATTLVSVEPVRGYGRWFERALQFVCATPGLRAVEDRTLRGLDHVFTLPVGRNPSKLDVRFEGDPPAEPATRGILRALLATMRLNEAGVLEDLDPEYLHDLRVAVRRTRSILGQMRGVFPPVAEEHYADEFRWVGRITGPTRDLDVLQECLPGYVAGLSGAAPGAGTALAEIVAAQRKKAWRKLARDLSSDRYRRLLENWEGFLATSTENGVHRALAKEPALAAASKRIWKRFRRITKRGRRIDQETPAAAIHDLRIECKKLRYLLETFRRLFPLDRIDTAVATLKRLQNTLGDFNDLQVHAELLTALAGAKGKGRPPEVVLEAGRLVGWLDGQREEKRQEFFKRFPEFDSGPTRTLYRELFHPRAREESS